MILKIVSLLFFALNLLLAGDLVVKETQLLYHDPANPGFFPAYSYDGTEILFTGNAYRGLQVLDRSYATVKQITDVQGAGFHPRSLSDGSIVFRQDDYVSGRKYTSLYKADNSGIHVMAEGRRFVSEATLQNDHLIFLNNEALVVLNGIDERERLDQTGFSAILNDKLKLRLLTNGSIKSISPLGEGNYIWSEMSPNADRIVFTQVGLGTYICDLDGNITTELGYAHAPHWSPEGKYLVYMMDEDDGDRYTASEIWVISSDGSQSWMISNTPDRIEMYPQWSPDGNSIVYHSLQGEIFETAIEIVN